MSPTEDQLPVVPGSDHATIDPYEGRSRHPRAYFDDLAGDYRAHRPGYPDAALDAMLEGLPPAPLVADVGCGTAPAAPGLIARGARVIGIDPSVAMLAEAQRTVSAFPARHLPAARGGASGTFETRRGTAEATGLERATVDVVLCAQSFHWFDAAHAFAEFARILKPGGRLVLAWNVRSKESPVSRAYDEIVERARTIAERDGRVTPRSRSADPARSPAFAPARRLAFPNPHRLDRAGLLGRARSASYFPAAGPERDRLVAELDALFDAHAEDGTIVLEQRSELTIAERLAD